MTSAALGKIGISKQRGFWLRCFLGAVIWGLLCVMGISRLHTQVDIPGPEHLTHVDGHVFDPDGHPVADLEVRLLQDGRVVYRTKTDQSGAFGFGHVAAGSYVFRIERSKYASAERQIAVTEEIVTVLQRKKLFVVLGPGACQDACSAVLTSKKEFDKAMRRNRRHE